ncbi:MAG TPA: ATP-dependent Clp protease proteolytic subunit, partial [Acidimicrobiales bacterium]|nr:ATP-dependent Clp protease proteolytic subunit [Acidimicrobiales bacterium]
NSKVMIHQGSAGTRGAPSDMAIHLKEVLATTRRMAEIIAFHSGQSVERVERDIDRDYFMTPDEAKAYGVIDEIISPHRGLCAPGAGSATTGTAPDGTDTDTGTDPAAGTRRLSGARA